MKSDVYGFGLVLLELVTVLPAFDNYLLSVREFFLRYTAEGCLTADESQLKRLIDRQLNGNYPLEGALQYVVLVQKCLEFQSIYRPTMESVLDTLERINGIMMDPNGNSAPVCLESVDLESDDWSTNIREDLLSAELPRCLNSYSGNKEDMELSGPR